MQSKDSISIEHAKSEDVTALTSICERAFHSDAEITGGAEGGPPGYNSEEWNSKRISSKFVDYYKILHDSSIVGGFIVGWRRKGYNVCERIFIEPDRHREGIGSEAFNLVFERYPQAQVWSLGTPEWNTRTRNFYEKLGFSHIGWTYDVPDWRGCFYQKKMDSEVPIQRITDLKQRMNRIVVEGRITETAPPRYVTSPKTGQKLEMTEVEIADDSGSIPLILWNEQANQVQSEQIRIEDGYVKSYQGRLQLSVSKWGIIVSLGL